MREGRLARLSQALVAWAERWFPDSYVFVLIATSLVAMAVLAHGSTPRAVSRAFCDGFWSLIPFTLQMTMVAIGGYVVAVSPPVAVALRRVAGLPRTGRGAVVFVALTSILLSLVNWGVSLIFSGLLVRAIAARTDLRLDYRAAGAAAYLGLGFGFTLGISSGPAQLQANATSIPVSLLPITGVIGFEQTILTWQNLVIVSVGTLLSVTVSYLTAPSDAQARTAADLGVDLAPATPPPTPVGPRRPGDWAAHSPVLTLALLALSAGWLSDVFAGGNPLVTLSGLNTYNFMFLLLGALLHWRPQALVASFAQAVPSVSGVLLQFPFYGGIAFMLTKALADGASLSDAIARGFVGLAAGPGTFSALVAVYSAVLGFLLPSAGGKWVIEAPYVMGAANALEAHLGWTLMVYNIAETLPNFINPFWMLPLLGVLGLRPRDLIGYTAVQFLAHALVLPALAALLMMTFSYHPPVVP
ncbi:MULTISPECIES: TIGR00366 family protein [unclassified Methylobacterium]|uniref:TIGR00366 family protein n=1 Tax=unclassified Methylobacterium TaxID=2615210 RepID=UPI002269C562|nr:MULTISPECIES: TIGR00366 family protein [unclassified Methylobacterium]